MPSIGQPFDCYIEIPPQMCLDLKAKVTAEFGEVGGISPSDIIHCNQASYVNVKFDFSACGDIKRLLCGNLCVCVAWESCGPGPEDKQCKTIPFTLCDKDEYVLRFDFPANTFPCPVPTGDCGTLYCLCLTWTMLDNCPQPKPMPIGGYCKGPCVLVLP